MRINQSTSVAADLDKETRVQLTSLAKIKKKRSSQLFLERRVPPQRDQSPWSIKPVMFTPSRNSFKQSFGVRPGNTTISQCDRVISNISRGQDQSPREEGRAPIQFSVDNPYGLASGSTARSKEVASVDYYLHGPRLFSARVLESPPPRTPYFGPSKPDDLAVRSKALVKAHDEYFSVAQRHLERTEPPLPKPSEPHVRSLFSLDQYDIAPKVGGFTPCERRCNYLPQLSPPVRSASHHVNSGSDETNRLQKNLRHLGSTPHLKPVRVLRIAGHPAFKDGFKKAAPSA
ncbi:MULTISPECIES: hypothetical protein [unclassified Caballeronia]|uniref:hypothetical protein n=1 Tax=unclassified Caballeronia TaxID=2646786 RepID=UPI002027E516|nr:MULTISPECIES: hypothetical protein [unclassified Caballeronia]